MEQQKINRIFILLLDTYGPQGWWPVYSLKSSENRDDRGYFTDTAGISLPRRLSPLSRFEIAVGAVLTQNTAWTNVERALSNLINLGLMHPGKMVRANQTELAEAIRPSGYYNQKSKKLKILTSFLLNRDYLENGTIPDREELLGLWGIGKETADSILLYAYGVPLFIVDTYTKRIFKRLKIIDGNEGYEEIAGKFTGCLERDTAVYQEYHALIVKHAKEYCRKKPVCSGCVLQRCCSL